MSITSINARPQVNSSEFIPPNDDRTSGVAQKIIKAVGAALAFLGAAAFIATASMGFIPLVAGIVLGVALAALGIGLLATITRNGGNGGGGSVYVAPSPVVVPRPVFVGRAPVPVVVGRGPQFAPPPRGMVTRGLASHAPVGDARMTVRV